MHLGGEGDGEVLRGLEEGKNMIKMNLFLRMIFSENKWLIPGNPGSGRN